MSTLDTTPPASVAEALAPFADLAHVPCMEKDEGWMAEPCGEPSAVIVWGNLSQPAQFGPKCRRHPLEHFPHIDDREIAMSAMFNLRPYARALTERAATD